MKRHLPMKSSNKNIVLSVVLAVICALALAVFLASGARAQNANAKTREAAAARKFTPFTLVTNDYTYASGKAHLVSSETVARRADGTTVMLNFEPQNDKSAKFPRRRFIQYVDGRQTEIYDDIHAFVNWPPTNGPVPMVREMLAPPKNCLRGPLMGEYLEKDTTLGGVKVAVIRSMPKGSSGQTLWLAPELGCQTVQETFTNVRANGSFQMVSEKKFVSLTLGPPGAELFAVPSTYASLSLPSAALREEAAKTGQPWDARMQAAAKQMDAQFAARKKHAGSKE